MATGPRLAGSADALRRTLLGRAFVAGDILTTSIEHGRSAARSAATPAFGLHEIRLRVVSTDPVGIVQIAEPTDLELLPEPVPEEHVAHLSVSYEDLGVFDDDTQVREMIELPLKHPELFDRPRHRSAERCAPSLTAGTGKTLLARAVANEAAADSSRSRSRDHLSLRRRIRKAAARDLRACGEKAPALIFMDEIDSIAPKRDAARGDIDVALSRSCSP